MIYVAAFSIISLLVLNSIGNYIAPFYQLKHVKPFGVTRSTGISEYLLHGSSEPLKVFGDAWYTGYLTYILYINNVTSIGFETLYKNTYYLWQINQNNLAAINSLHKYEAKIIINSEGAIYGTTWGYAVYINPKNLSRPLSMYSNRIYNNRFFTMFDILFGYYGD